METLSYPFPPTRINRSPIKYLFNQQDKTLQNVKFELFRRSLRCLIGVLPEE